MWPLAVVENSEAAPKVKIDSYSVYLPKLRLPFVGNPYQALQARRMPERFANRFLLNANFPGERHESSKNKVITLPRITASIIAALVVLSFPIITFAQSEKVIYEEAGIGFPTMVADAAGKSIRRPLRKWPRF
jgi:hypothetical protein